MFDTILVATDFSPLSRKAEGKALELAKRFKARCVLVHVLEAIDDGGPELEAFYQSLRSRAEKKLGESARPFEEAGLEVETRALIDRRWVGVIESANAIGADLIVLGSRPVLHPGRPTLGTTSHQVFFAAECPLLIVREPADG